MALALLGCGSGRCGSGRCGSGQSSRRRAPGYSSGFSTTAADEYWSGNPDLFTDHAALPEVERLLTVAQGHVLSQEMLVRLAGQAAAGVGRAETSLTEVEDAFRAMLGMSEEGRRRTAPIMQLMPAGTILTPGFVTKLGQSHGLLPVRVEWPADGDSWERRLVVYDNAGTLAVESVITFTRTDTGLDFVLSPDPFNRTSAAGWTLSQGTLKDNWLDPVTMPVDYVFVLSPVSVLIEDEEGRRFGVAGRRVFGDLPDVVPRDRRGEALPAAAGPPAARLAVRDRLRHVHPGDRVRLPRPVGHPHRRAGHPGHPGHGRDRRRAAGGRR